MEEGSLRCDVNISLKEKGSDTFGTKVEIKNLNSIANIEKAIDAEIIRQNELLDNNESIIQQTRRYDEATKTTIAMRDKEAALDYRYFPEPNIFPTMITDAFYQEAIASIPLMPDKKRQMLIEDYQLKEVDADILINNKALLDYFDNVIVHTSSATLLSNWLISEVLSLEAVHDYNKHIPAEDFGRFINLLKDNKINSKQAKEVFTHMLEKKKPDDIIKELNMVVIEDDELLNLWILQAIDNNPQSVVDYKNGKDRAVGFLVGQVMKLSKGQANPAKTNQLVKEELNKR